MLYCSRLVNVVVTCLYHACLVFFNIQLATHKKQPIRRVNGGSSKREKEDNFFYNRGGLKILIERGIVVSYA